jgi:hypothetical protein
MQKERRKRGWIITLIVVLIILGLHQLGKNAPTSSVESVPSSHSETETNSGIPITAEQHIKDQGAVEVPKISQWQVTRSTSPMDDSQTVTIATEAEETHKYRGFMEARPTLIIRCKENVTDIILNVGTMIDIQRDSNFNSYGVMRLRYDDQQAVQSNFDISTYNEAFFFRKPIDAAKKMIVHKKLVAQYQPYNEGNYVATFNLSGLEDKIQPLRDACKW